MMEAVRSSVTSVLFYETTRSHNPDGCLHTRRREILKPNVVVELLTLLLRIRKVSGKDLGPESGYPELGFLLYSSVPPSEWRDSTVQLGRTAFFQILSNSPFTYYPFIRRYKI
jgi:hypothetical protein